MNQEQAQQDLAFIRELMHSTRHATYVSGAYFINWALAISAGLLGTWLIITYQPTLPFHHGMAIFSVWIVVNVLGGIGAWILHRREKQAPAQDQAGRLIGMTWLAVGIGMCLIAFVGVGSGTLHGELMPALMAVLTGIGVFLTGTLSGLKWVRNLAFGWWIGASLMLVWTGFWNLWFTALLLLFLYLIPGIILNRNLKR